MAISKKSPSKVLSITQLPNGRIFLTAEDGVYEADVHGVWHPMSFAVEDATAAIEPPAPAAEPTP